MKFSALTTALFMTTGFALAQEKSQPKTLPHPDVDWTAQYPFDVKDHAKAITDHLSDPVVYQCTGDKNNLVGKAGRFAFVVEDRHGGNYAALIFNAKAGTKVEIRPTKNGKPAEVLAGDQPAQPHMFMQLWHKVPIEGSEQRDKETAKNTAISIANQMCFSSPAIKD